MQWTLIGLIKTILLVVDLPAVSIVAESRLEIVLVLIAPSLVYKFKLLLKGKLFYNASISSP